MSSSSVRPLPTSPPPRTRRPSVGWSNGDQRSSRDQRDYYSSSRTSRRPRRARSRSNSPEGRNGHAYGHGHDRGHGRDAQSYRRFEHDSPRSRDPGPARSDDYRDSPRREQGDASAAAVPLVERDLSLAPWQSDTSYPEYESRSVVCTHLATLATARDLGEFFESQLGEGVVIDVAIAKAKDNENKILGGFVELSHQKLVPKALGLTGHSFYGIPIRVEPTEAARLATFHRSDMFIPSAAQAPTHPTGTQDGSHGTTLDASHASVATTLPGGLPSEALPPMQRQQPLFNHPAYPPFQQQQAPGPSPFANASNNTAARLYVGSLAYEATAPEVQIVFARYGEVEYVDLHRENDTGKSKGFCFVQFKDPEAADLARMNLNGYELRSRRIKVGRVTARGTGSRPTMSSYGMEASSYGAPPVVPHGHAAPGYGQLPASAPVPIPLGNTGRPPALAAHDAHPAPAVVSSTAAQEAPPRTAHLQKMFNPAEETDPEWDLELARDVSQECQLQYGPIEDIFVDKRSEGDIFVKFRDAHSAQQAVDGLHGRLFGGNYIEAGLVRNSVFDSLRR